ncbi:MAG TPA: SCO family protein [Anaeromyxobacter sp.]
MSARSRVGFVASLLALALAAPGAALAQYGSRSAPVERPKGMPAPVLEDVRIVEKLGSALPLDTTFLDGKGSPFRLGSAFDGHRPVVLALVYYDCPMLCGLVLSGAAKAMRENGLVLGKDFQAVTISFDPEEKPALGAERRRGYLQSMGRSDGGGEWPFLVGTAAASRSVADAVGFKYARDLANGEWAHMAAIFILTPDGRVSRYLYGIEYPPKDLRLSLVEAAGGKVGTSFDRLMLTCYRYDPASRKYEPYAFGFLRVGGVLVLAALTTLIVSLVLRERRQKSGSAA